MRSQEIKIRGQGKKIYSAILVLITLISVSGVALSEGDGSLNQSYTWTGHGGYEAKGVGMGIVNPSTGHTTYKTYGNITLSQIPSNATIEKAFLYWECAGHYGIDTSCFINGYSITGTNIGKDGAAYIGYSYRAIITNEISGNGIYTITDLNAMGASIVVIYSNALAPQTTFLIADGADTNGNQGATGWMTPVTFSGFSIPQNPNIQITYIISDGQPYEPYLGYEPADKYSFNGNVIAVNDADGSDEADGARVWDTDTYDVTSYVNPGDMTATMNVEETTYHGDDLVWVAAILSISDLWPSQPEPTVDISINDSDVIISESSPVGGELINIQATVHGDKTIVGNATQPELIFSDNFDAGNLNKWSIGSWNPCGVCEVTNVVSHSPSYSFHSQSNPNKNTAPCIYKIIDNETKQLKFDTWFYLPPKTQAFDGFCIVELMNYTSTSGSGDVLGDYSFVVFLNDDDYSIDVKEQTLENGVLIDHFRGNDVFNLTPTTWNQVSVEINGSDYKVLVNENVINEGARIWNWPMDFILLGDAGGSGHGWGNAYWDDVNVWNITTTQQITHQGLNATCDVNFYLDSVAPGNQIGAVNNVLVPANGQVTVGVNWTAVAGTHNIIVDVTNVNPEDSNLSNNQAVKSVTVLGNTTATATGPQGAHHDPVITITYDWTGTPSAVDLYYSLNNGDNWNYLGTDTSVDGYYDWKPEANPGPKPSKYWWIANAHNGTDDVGVPADGTPPEAGPFNWKTWDVCVDVARTFSVNGDNWYFISIPLDISGDVLTVLDDAKWGDGGTSWDYIQWYDATDSVKPWKSYSIYRPQVLNDELAVDNTMGIWIHLTCNDGDGALTVGEGIESISTSINLHAGWNLVGYPSLNTRTVGDALSGTGADKVEVFDPSSPYRTKEVGSNHLMKPGEGYWIHVPTDTVWTVNW